MNLNGVLDELTLGDHVCTPVARIADFHRIAAVHTTQGLRQGHRVLLYTTGADTLRGALAATVPGATEALARQQIRIVEQDPPCAHRGMLHPESLIADLTAETERAERDGYGGLRLGMYRPHPCQPHEFESLLDCETQVNAVFAQGRASGVCIYHPCGFSLGNWRRLVAAHPSTVVPTGVDAVARLRCVTTDPGIRLEGEADLTNREALPVLLAGAVTQPGDCLIDAVDLIFADVHAVSCLLRVARLRGTLGTTIHCRPFMAELLDLLGARSVAHLTVVTDAPPHR